MATDKSPSKKSDDKNKAPEAYLEDHAAWLRKSSKNPTKPGEKSREKTVTEEPMCTDARVEETDRVEIAALA